MRTSLLIVGAALSGVYTLGSIGFLIGALITYDPFSARGGMEIAASVVPPCIGAVICLSCIGALRRKTPSDSTAEEE